MDWLSLVGQVVAKEKESTESEESEISNGDIPEDLIKPEGDLENFEVAGLLSVLHSLSLQLNILHSRKPDSARQNSKTSAKRLHGIIEKTISQLKKSGNFECLHSTVKEELIRRRVNARAERDNIENDRKIRQLQIQIQSNDKTKTRDMNKKQETIASLKDEVQNLIAKSECRMRYIDKWKRARQGENMLKCENAEMELKWQLESRTYQYNNEIIELEAEFEGWKERYHSEMKLRTEKISQLQGKAKQQQFRLQELKQLFNERQQDMEDYLKFKEERKAEEEQERFVNHSATKIQAWWRGTMVRRGLGPYKRRKKIAKDKKKGK